MCCRLSPWTSNFLNMSPQGGGGRDSLTTDSPSEAVIGDSTTTTTTTAQPEVAPVQPKTAVESIITRSKSNSSTISTSSTLTEPITPPTSRISSFGTSKRTFKGRTLIYEDCLPVSNGIYRVAGAKWPKCLIGTTKNILVRHHLCTCIDSLKKSY
jgi:hypothetical protein